MSDVAVNKDALYHELIAQAATTVCALKNIYGLTHFMDTFDDILLSMDEREREWGEQNHSIVVWALLIAARTGQLSKHILTKESTDA